ncbi:MAG: nucleoside deaminase [Bacteroidia bacterium]|nr:nucleoside deaminase [Bacteroidia bacterium]MCZ2276508.1 nucleoside deaminase [Bacteroidia bacterium]
MITFDDEYFMQAALTEARQAFKEDEIPVGAVVVCNQLIIARAHNMTEKLNDVSAHAEMIVLTSASNFLNSKYLNDCTIYVTLEPCIMCAGALAWAQIGRLVYGSSDPKKGFSKIASAVLQPKTILSRGVLEKDCSLLLTNFFKQKRD